MLFRKCYKINYERVELICFFICYTLLQQENIPSSSLSSISFYRFICLCRMFCFIYSIIYLAVRLGREPAHLLKTIQKSADF